MLSKNKSSKSKANKVKVHRSNNNNNNNGKSIGIGLSSQTSLSSSASTSSALKKLAKKKKMYGGGGGGGSSGSNHQKQSTSPKSAIAKLHSIQAKRASVENPMANVTTPKMRFEQPITFEGLRKQRQERKASLGTLVKKSPNKKLKNHLNMSHHQQLPKSTHSHSSSSKKSGRPTFQFKIGLQVGTSLGECYLQVQKLENSMDKLLTVSEDVSDVLQYLHDNNIGTNEDNYQPQSKHIKNAQDSKRRKQESSASLPLVDNPLEEVSILNENLIEWQRDSLLRMQAMSSSVRNLQSKLEELDKHHVHAQNLVQMNNNRDIDEAYRTISELQNDVYKTKMLLQDKNLEIQRYKLQKQSPRKNNMDSSQDARELELDRKECELDKDAELIAAQSEELRKESNRLLAEREEVRKQKEQWTKMIEEVKEQKAKLDEHEAQMNGRHQQLFDLHETLAREEKKLHRKAKKIKSREKRLNQLRNTNQNYVQPNFNSSTSNGGSDYGAESELTYFSDGDTAIESVNSISDDESHDNFHKQQMQATAHLGIPEHGRLY